MANRYVFKSRLNCSESTAGSCRWSGSEFQTVGPATENARVPSAMANSRNWQSMTSGRSQMLATRNFGDGHTVVDEVPWSSVPKRTMDCHSKLYCTRWGITSQCRSSRIIIIIIIHEFHRDTSLEHNFKATVLEGIIRVLCWQRRLASLLWAEPQTIDQKIKGKGKNKVKVNVDLYSALSETHL